MIAMIIKIIPPISFEYEPTLLPIIFPNVRPKYVNVRLVREKIIDDIK